MLTMPPPKKSRFVQEDTQSHSRVRIFIRAVGRRLDGKENGHFRWWREGAVLRIPTAPHTTVAKKSCALSLPEC